MGMVPVSSLEWWKGRKVVLMERGHVLGLSKFGTVVFNFGPNIPVGHLQESSIS